MTPSSSAPGLDLAPLAAGILSAALRSHARFDAEVWQASEDARVSVGEAHDAPSYHNESHIRSVADCSGHLFRHAAAGRDPFDLGGHLRLWNAAHPEAAASLDTLDLACRVAFACHDLGNITRSATVYAVNGTVKLDDASRYDSSTLYPRPEVEIRSAALCHELLPRFIADGELRRILEPLTHHLVLQTVFQFDKTSSDEPFWLFMQTVDMVGSYYFSEVPRIRSVAGLFNEMRVQKDGSIRIAPFLSSLRERYEKLLPDAERRASVLSMFEENVCHQSRDTVFADPGELTAAISPVPFREAIQTLLKQTS